MIDPEARANTGARLRHWLAFVWDVVFPPVCVHCRRMGPILCSDCRGQMVAVPDSICFRCGRFQKFAVEHAHDGLCQECRQHPSPVAQMRAPLRYQSPLDQVIHRFKYEGYFALAEPLAEYLTTGWPAWEQPLDLVLPIPLHPRRQRRRGYNQSALLARPLSQALGIAFAPMALHRVRHTIPQVGLGPEERRDNVRGAFSADPCVAGHHILLVDDVLTTGATMRSAAEALLSAGAASVSAYCLARVS